MVGDAPLVNEEYVPVYNAYNGQTETMEAKWANLKKMEEETFAKIIMGKADIIELLARVERVLRRYNKVSQTLTAYDIEVDTQSFQVKKAGVEIHLTKKEYEILVMFMRNPNVALFRERIFESVWHEPYYGDSRTVDLHVQRLRKKLGLEDKIVPVYKVGYRLEV